jgi:hypothetical protein
MTVVSINQPAYLPWLGYIQRIIDSDVHVVLDHVTIGKDAMTNRNKIRTPNGTQMLTVPIKNRGGCVPIRDIEIADDPHWARKHLMAIRNNYARAPFFKRHIDFFDEIYSREWLFLSPLLNETTQYFLDQWKITTPIKYSSDLKPRGVKTALNLELCVANGATKYISGAMGVDYLDTTQFYERGIQVEFQDYKHPVYVQCWPGFESHLSALDALFNCSEFPS